MPMQNTLNVSELLKRLGVVGDSQGSADLLDQIRLGITIADLSALVPPVAVPTAAASGFLITAPNNVAGTNIRCLSPGGLNVTYLQTDNVAARYNVWVSDTNPFATAPAVVPHANFTFGQPAESVWTLYAFAPPQAPADAVRVESNVEDLGRFLPPGNWVGPGQFFNVESADFAVNSNVLIAWQEYPAMLNP